MNPPLTLVPTDQIAPADLHGAFSRAFADYVAGPFVLTQEQWPGFVARQGVDLTLGRAAVDPAHGAVRAFALIAPRLQQGRWRLATLGAEPEARGSGAAVSLLEDVVDRGRAAGLRAIELEVFAQNERALNFYRRRGFVERHSLQGWQRCADAGDAQAPSAGMLRTAEQALAWLTETERAMVDLPLQVSAPIIAALQVPWFAWGQGEAQLVFSGDAQQGLIVRSLVDRHPSQGDAQALIGALMTAHPGAQIEVPPLQRPDLGGEALQRCGFKCAPLYQWLMCRELSEA